MASCQPALSSATFHRAAYGAHASRPSAWGYAISTALKQPYDAVVAQVRAALADQGFGILTEIDLQAAMKAKLDADIAPEVISCRPPLALAARQA